MGRIDHLNADGYTQPLVEVKPVRVDPVAGMAWAIRVNGLEWPERFVVADTPDEAVTTAQALVMREWADWRAGSFGAHR